jgi:hypothetical protein
LTTSYKTIVGTSLGLELSMKGANFAASVSWVRYSSQAEESISKSSETVVAVTVIVFPFHALGYPSKFRNRTEQINMEFPFIDVHEKFLAGFDFQFFPDGLRNHDLKFGRDFDSGFGDSGR